MQTLLVGCLLCALVGADEPQQASTPRKPNPFAPSLPQLTDDEENELDRIIDQFIKYDTGRLHGEEARQALRDFQKLGPEAIPALIRGLNRAAHIDHSCPAVTIAKKLARMLRTTHDAELLEFARENIGAGVTQSRHMGVIKDLRIVCMLRKRALYETGEAALRTEGGLRASGSTITSPGPKKPMEMTITELVQAAGSEQGSRLKPILTELGRRNGDAAIAALGSAAATYDRETQSLARDLLRRQLSRLPADKLKEKFKDDRAEVRAAAAWVAGNKDYHLENQLVELLSDEEKTVREAAHEALVRLSKGTDFGPKPDADDKDRKLAEEKWRSWASKRGGP